MFNKKTLNKQERGEREMKKRIAEIL